MFREEEDEPWQSRAALETHIAGKRVAPHFYPIRRPWLFEGAAANASSVVPLVVAKTELCCNEYKGGPLLKLLNAYRLCNSHWLSSFQTGWLLPDVATQGLPKSWSGVCCKKMTGERENESSFLCCECCALFFVVTLHTLCWMHFAARHNFMVGIFWLFLQASCWNGVDTFWTKSSELCLCCAAWAGFPSRSEIGNLLLGTGF